jgi:predicted Fe-Mo cluster-binding NifX family protein
VSGRGVQDMQVAMTIWNGRISPVFDVARQILVVEIEEGCEVARRLEALPGTDLRSQAERFGDIAPQVLICGAISEMMVGMLENMGVAVIPFIAGPTEQVLAAWLAGELLASDWSMPGCCGRMRRCRGQRGRGRGGRSWQPSPDSVSKTRTKGMRDENCN